jgi:hypothetical protein
VTAGCVFPTRVGVDRWTGRGQWVWGKFSPHAWGWPHPQIGIPVPRAGEASFWSCSILPGKQNGKIRVLTRININWQEVFFVTNNMETGEICYEFFLASSPFSIESDLSYFTRQIKFWDLIFDKIQHGPAGQDQTSFSVNSMQSALQIFDDSTIWKAIRLLNLRLMKKGANNFSRYHCMDMADLLLAQYE